MLPVLSDFKNPAITKTRKQVSPASASLLDFISLSLPPLPLFALPLRLEGLPPNNLLWRLLIGGLLVSGRAKRQACEGFYQWWRGSQKHLVCSRAGYLSAGPVCCSSKVSVAWHSEKRSSRSSLRQGLPGRKFRGIKNRLISLRRFLSISSFLCFEPAESPESRADHHNVKPLRTPWQYFCKNPQPQCDTQGLPIRRSSARERP